MRTSLNILSADLFLGVPYNVAFYALTLQFFACMFEMAYGELVLNLVDAHVYLNHEDAVNTQLHRTEYDLPKVQFSDELRNSLKELRKSINDPDTSIKQAKALFDNLISNIEYGKDVMLLGYTSHTAIKADVSV